MKISTEINDVQASIIRQLLLRDSLRFSEINVESLPSDQFSYHLRQLVKYKLVEKDEKNSYKLSVMGRSRALMLDNRSNKFIEQGFIAVRVLLSKEENGQTFYLIQERTRVPYIGYWGEPGGKVVFGEDIAAAARRNMITETGLDCEIQICGLAHYRDSYREALVQDKYFFVTRATNSKGTLLPYGPTGKNMWITLPQIVANPRTHKGVPDLIRIACGDEFVFSEQIFMVDEY